MNNWHYYLIPLLTAFTGLLTAWILFKFCFHPRKPIRLFGFTIQGLFPKLKKDLPGQLGELIGKELSSSHRLKDLAGDPNNLKPILPLIENHIDDFLRNKLPVDIPMVAMFVGDKTIELLKQSFLREMQSLFPEVMREYAAGLQTKLNMQGLVEKKIEILATEFEGKLENKLHKQFTSIGLIAALAGLVCGLIFVGFLLIL